MLTQKAIDARGPYYPVKDWRIPVTKKTVFESATISYNKMPGVFIPGDRSECIPGERIIRVLRQESRKKGIRFGYLTVAEVQDTPRWVKVAVEWLVGLIGLGAVIGMLISAVRP